MGAKKDAAVSFLTLAASGRVRDAWAMYVGPRFRHHNPYFAGDAESLMKGMEENARQHPDKRLNVLHALEDGDFVAVHAHVRLKQGDRGVVIVHLYCFEDDRIVELWDISQPVPAESVNANGML
jgi:predicted SnoaL-like aldol condensation-catalyzing enzyme